MTNYKTGVKLPFQEKSNIHDKRHPINKMIAKHTGEINLNLSLSEDTQTLNQFKNFPGLVSFIATLRRDSIVVGVGHGSVLINESNRWVERALAFAKNTAIINSVMMACKMLDALKIDTGDVKGTSIVSEEIDVERRDEICSYEEDSTLKYATEKQKTFLKSLLDKADKFTKDEYLPQLNEKYLSSFQCSQLISDLLQK